MLDIPWEAPPSEFLPHSSVSTLCNLICERDTIQNSDEVRSIQTALTSWAGKATHEQQSLAPRENTHLSQEKERPTSDVYCLLGGGTWYMELQLSALPFLQPFKIGASSGRRRPGFVLIVLTSLGSR